MSSRAVAGRIGRCFTNRLVNLFGDVLPYLEFELQELIFLQLFCYVGNVAFSDVGFYFSERK